MQFLPTYTIEQSVDAAFELLAPLWPIHQSAAVNPLANFTSQPYPEALARAREIRGIRAVMPEAYGRARYQNGLISSVAFKTALQQHLRMMKSPESSIFHGTTFHAQALLETALTRTWETLQPELEAVILRHAESAVPLQSSALGLLSERCDSTLGTSSVSTINEHAALWCAAFLDRDTAAWPMPHRDRGFFASWRHLVRYDTELSAGRIHDYAKRHAAMPKTAAETLEKSLHALRIPPTKWTEYLQLHVLQLPGWASSILWHSQKRYSNTPVIEPIEYLAIRLWYETALVETAVGRARIDLDELHLLEPKRDSLAFEEAIRALRSALLLAPELKQTLEQESELETMAFAWLRRVVGNEIHRSIIWMNAEEHHVHDRLLARFTHPSQPPQNLFRHLPTVAEFMFCIDARSEPLRRAIERQGSYLTHGFAGFFGISLELQRLDRRRIGSHPPMMNPAFSLIEHPQNDAKSQSILSFKRFLKEIKDILDDSAEFPSAAFALTEIVGIFSIFPTIIHTVMPGIDVRLKTIFNQAIGTIRSHFLTASSHQADSLGILGLGFENECDIAYEALKSMELLHTQTRYIFLIGHATSSRHQVFRSAFSCGSCSGRPGGIHAHILAQLLNHEDIRNGLRARGARFSEQTVFLAAEHDTSTDKLAFFPREHLPDEKREELILIEQTLALASEQAAIERIQNLPTIHKKQQSRQALALRGCDWAQTLPELGFAGHEALIIGSRSLSANVNLEGRVFLHDYDAGQDHDGSILSKVLARALSIAQAINASYHFASTDPEMFCSGHLLTQNLVGGFGVSSRRRGDLRVGLPQQAFTFQGQALHQPLRLLTIVDAPKARIAAAVSNTPLVRELVENQWVCLIGWDAQERIAWQLGADGQWSIRLEIAGEPTYMERA